jgi:hypothetical protein
MTLPKEFKPTALVIALALGSTLILPLAAHADGTQNEINASKAQLQMLNQKSDDLSKKQDKTDQTATQASQRAAAASDDAKKGAATFERIQIPQRPDSYKPGTVNMHTGATNPAVMDSDNFMNRERDDSLTFSIVEPH